MTTKSWNEIIVGLDNPHVLQTTQWAEVKEHYGWQAHYLIWTRDDGFLQMIYSKSGEFSSDSIKAAALVLERKAFFGLSLMYIPKGPLLINRNDLDLAKKVLADLKEFALEFDVIQLKIDPDIIIGWGVPGDETETSNESGIAVREFLLRQGWTFSSDQVQFRNTVLVDLKQDQEHILGRMKSKTRYNIRLAGRKGISVRQGAHQDLDMLYDMYANTSLRGGFTIRGEDYYQTVWRKFIPESTLKPFEPVACPLIAEFGADPVAGAVVFKFGKRAWYLHGMSLTKHKEKMAPHLIQWEGMKWAKEAGCEVYDMWGAPDQFDETDSLWGVYRFKRGYGGFVVRTIGAWDFPAKPILYFIYTVLMPRVLAVMRWFGNRRTRGAANDYL